MIPQSTKFTRAYIALQGTSANAHWKVSSSEHDHQSNELLNNLSGLSGV